MALSTAFHLPFSHLQSRPPGCLAFHARTTCDCLFHVRLPVDTQDLRDGENSNDDGSPRSARLVLILQCRTRWAPYWGEFQRLISQSKVLRTFTTDSRIQEITKSEGRLQSVVKTIQSHLFWPQFAQLEEIITPIAEAQVLAQTDQPHPGYVQGR